MKNNITRIDIADFKVVCSEIKDASFSDNTTTITGLVSILEQQIIRYYDEFRLHQFTVLVWDDVSENTPPKELIVYRAIAADWDDSDGYLQDIPPLSAVQLDVYVSENKQTAIFNAGHFSEHTKHPEWQKTKEKYAALHHAFGAIRHDYDQNYVSETPYKGKTIKYSFEANASSIALASKAYDALFPLEDLHETLAQCALDDLFELTQKGWFARDHFSQTDFLQAFRQGHFLQFFINENDYSIWYENKTLFGHRIIFEGDYVNGIQKTKLFVQMGPERNYNKAYLLGTERQKLTSPHFGTLTLDQNEHYYQGNTAWCNRTIPLNFAANTQKTIDTALIDTAKTLVDQSQHWEEKAYNYAIAHYLSLKNEAWLQTDEPPLTAAQFKAQLGTFSLYFDNATDIQFSFDTDDALFGGHGIILNATLSDGFVGHEMI